MVCEDCKHWHVVALPGRPADLSVGQCRERLHPLIRQVAQEAFDCRGVYLMVPNGNPACGQFAARQTALSALRLLGGDGPAS